MSTIVACKLPHGLSISHMGQTININGTNVDHDPLNPSPNGATRDSAVLSAGYGLTTLDDKQSEAFADWSSKATYVDGDKAKGQLAEPFPPLVNGAIRVHKSEAEARKDTVSNGDVATGLDGLDGDAEMKKAAAGSPDLVNSGKGT